MAVLLNLGPLWDKVYQEFKGKVLEGQVNRLKELVLHGAYPVYLGPTRG